MHDRKKELRSRVLAVRDALPDAARGAHSQVIAQKILSSEAFRAARVVLLYSSFGKEFDTSGLIRAAVEARKTLVFPKVNRSRDRLDLYQVRLLDRDLVPGIWGIREPDPEQCPPVSPSALDFILMPGVAFDREGGRLGYGKGYYDKLLASCGGGTDGPSTVAAAFECQLVDAVPREAHDVPVDAVVTEASIYPARR